MDRHISGFPTFTLKKIIKEHSIIKVLTENGFKADFINCYRPTYLEKIYTNPKFPVSTSTHTQLASNRPLKTIEDLLEGKALYMDISNKLLNPYIDPKMRLPDESFYQKGKNIFKNLAEYDFCLFEYFLTDIVGHEQNWEKAKEIILNLEEFIQGLLDGLDIEKDQLIIASDHGNFEDFSKKTHTRNYVPTFLQGKYTKQMKTQIHSIVDISPIIYTILRKINMVDFNYHFNSLVNKLKFIKKDKTMLIQYILSIMILSLFTFGCSSKKQNSNQLPLYLLSQSDKKDKKSQDSQNQVSFDLKGLGQYKDTMAYKVSSVQNSSSLVNLNTKSSSWVALNDKKTIALNKKQIVEFALYKASGQIFELGSILSSQNKNLDISQILSSDSSNAISQEAIETFDSFFKSLATKNEEGKYELSNNFDTFVGSLTTKTKRGEVLNRLKISKTIDEFKTKIEEIKDLVAGIKNTIKGLLKKFITTPKFTYSFDITAKTLTISFEKKQFNSADLNYKFYYKIAASEVDLALATYKTTGTNLSSGSPISLADFSQNKNISVVLVACKDKNFTDNLNIGIFVSPKPNKITDCGVSLPITKKITEVANNLIASELLDFELVRANPAIAKVNYKRKDFPYHHVFLKAPGKIDLYTQLENKWYWNFDSHFDQNRKYKIRNNNLDTSAWNKQKLKITLVSCIYLGNEKVKDYLNISTNITSKNTKKCRVSQEKTFYTTDTKKPSAISGDLKDSASRYYYGVDSNGNYYETRRLACSYSGSTSRIDFEKDDIDRFYNNYEKGISTIECETLLRCQAIGCRGILVDLKYSKKSMTPRFVESTSGGVHRLYGSFFNPTFKQKYGTKYVPLSDKPTSIKNLEEVKIKYDLKAYSWNGKFVVAQCPKESDFKNLTLLELDGNIVSNSNNCNISNIANMKSYWDIGDKLYN